MIALLATAVLLSLTTAGIAARPLLPGDSVPAGAAACVPTLRGGAFCFNASAAPAVAFVMRRDDPFTEYMWRPESVQLLIEHAPAEVHFLFASWEEDGARARAAVRAMASAAAAAARRSRMPPRELAPRLRRLHFAAAPAGELPGWLVETLRAWPAEARRVRARGLPPSLLAGGGTGSGSGSSSGGPASGDGAESASVGRLDGWYWWVPPVPDGARGPLALAPRNGSWALVEAPRGCGRSGGGGGGSGGGGGAGSARSIEASILEGMGGKGGGGNGVKDRTGAGDGSSYSSSYSSGGGSRGRGGGEEGASGTLKALREAEGAADWAAGGGGGARRCSYAAAIQEAESAGAAGVLLYPNARLPLVDYVRPMSHREEGLELTLPAAMLPRPQGLALAAALGAGAEVQVEFWSEEVPAQFLAVDAAGRVQEVGWMQFPSLAHLMWAGQWLTYSAQLQQRLARGAAGAGRGAGAAGPHGPSARPPIGPAPATGAGAPASQARLLSAAAGGGADGSRSSSGSSGSEAAAEDRGALVVPIFDARPLPPSGRRARVRLPSADARAAFDSLWLHFRLDCPGRFDKDCPQWDHIIQLFVCCDDPAGRLPPCPACQTTQWLAPERGRPMARGRGRAAAAGGIGAGEGGSGSNSTSGIGGGGASADAPCGFELGRWATPFRRRGGEWLTEVTALRGLLASGSCAFTLQAPPWAGDWVPSVALRFERGGGGGGGGGEPAGGTSGSDASGGGSQGDGIPAAPPPPLLPLTLPLFAGGALDGSLPARNPPVPFPTPPRLRRALLVAVLSGHGSDGLNCGEFCVTRHAFSVNGRRPHALAFEAAGTAWGCAQLVPAGAMPNLHGTWLYGRGGWCDALPVAPWVVDVTADLLPAPGAAGPDVKAAAAAAAAAVGAAGPTALGAGSAAGKEEAAAGGAGGSKAPGRDAEAGAGVEAGVEAGRVNSIEYAVTMPDGQPPHDGEASPGYVMASVFLVFEVDGSEPFAAQL
ncbi:hypothetical protein Rsub_09377 [Raphidocelis subcapitata]|uniref:Peptide-N-glycosidase F N-terminal domain-containing protein n=1 Tax=Raphidocelis subcapitata TaxID=307507 RepID=A0A2V0P9W2_9CHLO|nr:hypothetical protein Rsub_09377 [Raphidocelis subcapitata]|eukprot:GBF96631.1 hypothetical protein Rsub_09377 [Raphidocelis subcapitata]